MEFAAQFRGYQDRVEQGLNHLIPAGTTRPARLHEAMRYALLGGGKRLRPILTLATADCLGARHDALPAAIALECIHTYSLVHDDLPCMDNDDLRRGRPTTHKQFDEATALLAGDALLTLAFQLVARHYATLPPVAAALTRELADAAGSERLIGGQMEDLLAEKKANATADELEFIHLNKTAAMLAAAVVAGGICAGAGETQLAALRLAGRHLGLAFQIVDDILDATADTATLGKTAGKDARADKTTYVKLHGLDASRQLARQHTDAALVAFAALPGDRSFLVALVESMAGRTKMSGQRQDYLLRQIDLLRQAVRRAMRKQPDPELDESLLLAFHLQEKLFPVPPAEFLALTLPEQILALRRNESREAGNAKCRLYAALLAETALLYEHKSLPDLASGARQMGFFAALSVVLDDAADAEAGELARTLLATLDVTTLHPPVIALLQQVRDASA